MKYIAIDFEYKNSQEKILDLVCASWRTCDGQGGNAWLYQNDENKLKLKEILLSYRDTHTIIAHNVAGAEGIAFISLGLDPVKFNWYDTQIEAKMLYNHYDKLRYGTQYFPTGIKHTRRKDYFGDKKPHLDHTKPATSLESVTFKFLDIAPEDTKYKEKMRNLILKTKVYSETDKRNIMEYCASDINQLIELKDKQLEWYKKLGAGRKDKRFKENLLLRGESAARTARITAEGYPVDRSLLNNFLSNYENIILSCQEDINRQFPDIVPFHKTNKKAKLYSQNTKAWIQWISSQGFKKWRRTPKGELSLSLDAFSDYFKTSHEYERGNFGQQCLRFLKLKQSLNGFSPYVSGKKHFLDFYGSDDRARPWLNPYGAQSSRFQPGAAGFIPLKAAWMRSLILPKKGKAVVGIDYGSQEILISALVAKDKNMFEAYTSGDPYLWFAKAAKAVPQDGTKDEYKRERNLFKATTLAVSYGMTAKGLAEKITSDTKEDFSEDKAQELIDMFYEVFSDYEEFVTQTKEDYEDDGYLMLPDGWIMWGDNDNFRSYCNFPIQGFGASILRKAIELCQDKGLKVIYPLHDALYVEIDDDDLGQIDLMIDCMRQAFCHFFDGEWKKKAEAIRLDVDLWGRNLPHPPLNERLHEDKNIRENCAVYVTTPKGVRCKSQNIYIDERSWSEFSFFKKYLFQKDLRIDN